MSSDDIYKDLLAGARVSTVQEEALPSPIIPKEEEEQDFFKLKDFGNAMLDVGKSIIPSSRGAIAGLSEGVANPADYSELSRSGLAEARLNQERVQVNQERAEKEGTASTVGTAIRGAAPSIGFTLANMAVAVPTHILGSKIGGKVGGLLLGLVSGAATAPEGGVGAAVGVPAGVVAGSAIGGSALSGAATFASAYRMAGASFMEESIHAANQLSIQKTGKPMSEADQEAMYNKLLPLAKETGIWEAGPEAVGAALNIYFAKKIFGVGGSKMVGNLLSKALKKAGLAATDLGFELLGETTTQVGQNDIQERANAIIQGQDPDALVKAPLGQRIVEAGKQVAGPTVATMGILGSVGGGVQVAGKGFSAVLADKAKVQPKVNLSYTGPVDADYQAFHNKLTSEMGMDMVEANGYVELYKTLAENQGIPEQKMMELVGVQKIPSAKDTVVETVVPTPEMEFGELYRIAKETDAEIMARTPIPATGDTLQANIQRVNAYAARTDAQNDIESRLKDNPELLKEHELALAEQAGVRNDEVPVEGEIDFRALADEDQNTVAQELANSELGGQTVYHGTLVNDLEAGKLLPTKAAKDDLQAVFFATTKDGAMGYAVQYDPETQKYNKGQVITATIPTGKTLEVSAKQWKNKDYDTTGYDVVKILKAERSDPSWLVGAFPEDTYAVLNPDVINIVSRKFLSNPITDQVVDETAQVNSPIQSLSSPEARSAPDGSQFELKSTTVPKYLKVTTKDAITGKTKTRYITDVAITDKIISGIEVDRSGDRLSGKDFTERKHIIDKTSIISSIPQVMNNTYAELENDFTLKSTINPQTPALTKSQKAKLWDAARLEELQKTNDTKTPIGKNPYAPKRTIVGFIKSAYRESISQLPLMGLASEVDGMVIVNEEGLKIGRTLLTEQKQTSPSGDIKGVFRFINGQKRIIGLTKEATRDTFLHETGHLFMTFLDEVQLGVVAAYSGTNIESLIKYNKGANLTVEDQANVTRAGEMFANGFVRYLAEGKAPNIRLKELFKRFATYLKQVFRTASDIQGAENLSPEMRKLYASLLTTKQDIASGSIVAPNLPVNIRLLKDGEVFLSREGKPSIEVYNTETHERKILDVTPLVDPNPVLSETQEDAKLRELLRSGGPSGAFLNEYRRVTTSRENRGTIDTYLGKNPSFRPVDFNGSQNLDVQVALDNGTTKFTIAELKLMSLGDLRKIAKRAEIEHTISTNREDLVSAIITNGNWVNNWDPSGFNRISPNDLAGMKTTKFLLSYYSFPVIEAISYMFPQLKYASEAGSFAGRAQHKLYGDIYKVGARLLEITNAGARPKGWKKSSRRIMRDLHQRTKLFTNSVGDELWETKFGINTDKRFEEFRTTPLSPEEAEVVAEYHKLYDYIGKIAVEGEYLLQGKMVKGLHVLKSIQVFENGVSRFVNKYVPKKLTEGLVQRVPTEDFHKVFFGGDSILTQRAIRLIAEHNNQGPAVTEAVEKMISEIETYRSEYKQGMHVNIEAISTLDQMPSTMVINGKVYRILETHPFFLAAGMMKKNALRLGYLKAFDTDPKFVKMFIDRVTRDGGQQAYSMIHGLINALHGVRPKPLIELSGTAFNHILEAFDAVWILKKALSYSGMIWSNAFELITKVPSYAGNMRYWKMTGKQAGLIANHMRVKLTNLVMRKDEMSQLSALRKVLVEQGVIVNTVSNYIIPEVLGFSGGPLEFHPIKATAALSRIAAQSVIKITGGKDINVWNAISAGIAGQYLEQSLRDGNFDGVDVARLEHFGFSTKEITEMTTNPNSPLISGISQRMVALTQNTDLFPAEQSALATSKIWGRISFADNYPRGTLHAQMLLQAKLFSDSWNKSNPQVQGKGLMKQRAGWLAFVKACFDVAVQPLYSGPLTDKLVRHFKPDFKGTNPTAPMLRKFYIGHGIAAVLIFTLIRGLMKGPANILPFQPEDDNEETRRKLLTLMGELMMISSFGGIFTAVYWQMKTLRNTGNTADNALIAAMRSTYVVNELATLWEAFAGEGYYKAHNGMERFVKYLSDTTVGASRMRRIVTLAVLDQEADNWRRLSSKYYDFMSRNTERVNVVRTPPKEVDFNYKKSTEAVFEASRQIRLGMESLKRGMTGEYVGNEPEEHFAMARAALGEEGASKYDGMINAKHMYVPEELREKWEAQCSADDLRWYELYNELIDRKAW